MVRPVFQAEGAYLRTRGLGPDFARLWTANAVSNLGDGVTLVAGPLLAASLTRDPRLVAGLAVAQRLPWLLFSLVSGAMVDRLDRRLLMVRVDAARAGAVGLLGVAVLADAATLPLLYVVFFALGTAETLFDNAAISILPSVVPREQLARANGRLLGVQMVANELVAPPVGGLLFATAAAVPFLLDAGSFAAAAALVAAMSGRFRVERPEGTAPTTLRSEIAEGVRWLARHRLLLVLALARSPFLVGVIFALFGFHAMTWSVISVSLRQELIPARLLGRVNSAYALFGFGSLSLGAIAGGVLAARYGLTAPFWCSFAAMTVLTLTCWPILSARAVAQARAQAATGRDGP